MESPPPLTMSISSLYIADLSVVSLHRYANIMARALRILWLLTLILQIAFFCVSIFATSDAKTLMATRIIVGLCVLLHMMKAIVHGQYTKIHVRLQDFGK